MFLATIATEIIDLSSICFSADSMQVIDGLLSFVLHFSTNAVTRWQNFVIYFNQTFSTACKHHFEIIMQVTWFNGKLWHLCHG